MNIDQTIPSEEERGRAGRNPKPEGRGPKEVRNPKTESIATQPHKHPGWLERFRVSVFGLPSAFEDSDFGIHWPPRLRAGVTPTIWVVLTLATLMLYWPLTHHQFISIDDDSYIYDNPNVKAGLTWAGSVWALRTGWACNWHPLTWISHMADCQLYGLAPGGHHFTNLLYHTANTLLLFFLLRRMTGALWRSALVAALFAWHPLHVESVAWASERKDVLSTFFFILTLLAYHRYATNPGRSAAVPQPATCNLQPATVPPPSSIRYPLSSLSYFLALLLFALGLMSKPMLVTLPFVLLLLDIWPLGRLKLETRSLELRTVSLLFLEKLPFFFLAAIASVVTLLVQRAGGAVWALDTFSLPMRLANAVLAYAGYLSKTLWPAHLSIIYPLSRHMAPAWVAAAAGVLLALSLWFSARLTRQPWLAVGWFWFLGTLVPTIGLVQVGSQAMADRYMYIPSIGLFVVLVWGAAELLSGLREGLLAKAAAAGAAAFALAACLVCTSLQLKHWENNVTLFGHAVKVTQDNYIALNALGCALDSAGKPAEAKACYEKSAAINPRDPEAQYYLGTVLMREGKLDEAMAKFQAVLEKDPKFGQAHNYLGSALLQQHRLDEAAAHFVKAIEFRPYDPETHYKLGTILLTQSKLPEAVAQLVQAVRLKPDYWEAHSNLGIAFMRLGRGADGAAHLVESLRLNPGNAEGQVNLGMALLDLNQPAKAAQCFSEALRLKPDEPRTHYHLARALARQGKSNEAASQAEQARSLALARGQNELVAQAGELLKQLTSTQPSPPPR